MEHGVLYCSKEILQYNSTRHVQVYSSTYLVVQQALLLSRDNITVAPGIICFERRPRWLGRLSSCLLKSIPRVQFSPSAHTRRDLSLIHI